MVVREIVKHGSREYLHTYSDCGFKVHCTMDGKTINYDHAIDLVDTNREYVETDIPVSAIYLQH